MTETPSKLKKNSIEQDAAQQGPRANKEFDIAF